MKRIGILAIIGLILSCRGPQASPRDISVNAVNGSYTPIAESNRGIVALDLIVQNDGNVSARLGCGMSMARKDNAGIKKVAEGACLAADSGSNAPEREGEIRPASSDTLRVTRNISSEDFTKDATFRIALSIAFGPSFRTGLPFTSSWFKPVEKPEQDIRDIQRLLSDTR
jgi:hypothetical protein